MKKIIELVNLSKVFETKVKGKFGRKETKSFTAVDNINLEVNQGEIVGFIGPNGAGKSTTIKMMTGILWKTSGEAIVAGFNPWKERQPMTYKIGTMFGQKSSLLSHLPVIDSYKLLGAIYDIDKEVLNERIEEITNYFDINELLNQKVSSLSLGQRMICEVAAVTLHRPDIIFFDEPTIGLDIVVKKKVRDMILNLNKKYGTTIFITSHDISDIEKLCSRIVIINHGKIMLDKELVSLQNTYLSSKKLSVSFDDNVSLDMVKKALEEFEVKITFEDKYIIEYDQNNVLVASLIVKLTQIGNVTDISISTTSLENVIFDIYTRGNDI